MKLYTTQAMAYWTLMGLIPLWQGGSLSMAADSDKNSLGCLDPTKVDYSHDYFPEKAVLEYSDEWTITYNNTYKIICNKPKNVTYLLYQCGTEPPASEEGKHHLTLQVPLQNGVAVTSTTQIPPLEHLGVRRQIKAFISTYDDAVSAISSPCLNYLIDESVTDVVDSANLDTYLAANEGMVVFGGPFTNAALPNYMIISESSEKHPKDIYEWQKLFGALFNLEGLSNKVVAESVKRFDCATADAAAAVKAGSTNRTVAWAYYSDYSSGWSVATCDPTFNYYCTYAQHCNANLLHSNEGSIEQWGTKYMNDTEFVEFAKDADHLLYMSNNWNKTYTERKAVLDQLVSVQNKEVFDYMGSGPNAWFEQRISEYDVVLQDFCDVVDMTSSESKHKRQWFRHVFTEPIGSLGTCSDAQVDEPWKTRASSCLATPTAAPVATDTLPPTAAPASSTNNMAIIPSSLIAMGVAFWIFYL